MTMSATTTTTKTHRRPLSSLPPTESLEIGHGLSLSPRVKLLLTFFRADATVRPLDDWKLKNALLSFLRSPPLSLSHVPDDDLLLRRLPDLHKRKRDEAVATGTLYIRDLSFLKPTDGENGGEEMLRKRFLDWRESVVEKLSGIELNIEGVKFKMTLEIPVSGDFEKMKKSWEDFYAFKFNNSSNFMRSSEQKPDTIVVRGVPSRWFAEPLVPSKASQMVTHTIFSVFGKIRNINVSSDDNQSDEADDTKGDLVSGLNCKIWVRFETYDDFYGAMNVLCSRSMQKEGSRLKVDYDVTWDCDNFFRSSQQKLSQPQLKERERGREMKRERERQRGSQHLLMEHSRNSNRLHANFDNARRKRFKVYDMKNHFYD
ncbi:ZCW7 [Rhynchospora pubera]|uniref:ZCW7 n=1 Tax=Rhynchospora pubera TaxID=906938 RepID=A0AAV8HFC6_9POAL|nr:ZCW7 [Rhynchospora pubera]